MEAVSGVAGEATKSVITHGERELNYIFRFKRNIKNLGDNITALDANIRDVRSWVDAARNNNHLIRNTVDTWLEQADRLFEEATRLKSEAGDINSWWKGWVTCSRFSLGRKAAKKNVDIQKHLGEGSKFGENNVSNPMPVQSYELEPVGDFKTFASREATKSEVIATLRADENSLVGIYGMPGVGKTMLMKAVMAQLKKEKVFDEVVMVVVSQKPDLEKIQDAIAEKLDLKFKGKLFSTRAAELRERLHQERKTLLCLDDVWEPMELVEVGIPYKNAGNRCKVIFTTRIQGVCERMEMDEKIEVGVLSKRDSSYLFRSKAGVVVDSPLFETVAGNIVKECKGLPLAIVTLGLALRNKDDIAVWDDTLKRLKKSISKDMEPVNASIRLSYDFLQDETTKMCFLFCCMFPEDFQIRTDVLFGYMMGEKLIRDVDTFEEARNRLQATVEKLTSAGLLLKDDYGDIMMHDVVRDVAVSIACEQRNEFIVKAKMNFREWPDMELEKCKRLSLMDTEIRELVVIGKLVTLIPCRDFVPESVNQYKGEDVGDEVEQGSSSTRLCYLPPSPIFHNLTDLDIRSCPKLKHLFPLRVFQRLSKLEVMHVVWCSALEILFPDDSDIESGDVDKDKASHPLLKEFSLFDLPKLSSFSGNDSLVVDWPSAKSLTVFECSNLKRLPLGTHSVPKLEEFRITNQEWFNKLEWDDQRIKAELQTLLKVKC
ncbi:hypothetical protein IFM89_017711 [Coptis chinensis]|uniref:AAA+ ATPase domain-containing protein n=1 Tax=Coptis chinensis TaxID=261450 RepID=A0A835HBM1_9MAGN|nr:hypothetical protein IFM89_017711 [Coptis chinensis]